MKTADELKQKAYKPTGIFTFSGDELEEYVNQCKNEGLEKLMYDFFKGSGFERLAEAQQKEAAKQQEIKRNKEIREQYDYLKWRKDNHLMMTEQQQRDYEFCVYKIEVESKQNG